MESYPLECRSISAARYNQIKILEDQETHVVTEHLHYLAEIIVRYKLEDVFGICLLHRHFNLQDGFVLMHTRNDANEDIGRAEYVGTQTVYPCAYIFDEQEEEHQHAFRAFEFSPTAVPLPTRSFLDDIATYLRARNLSRILGISHISEPERFWLEHLSPDGSETIATAKEHREHDGINSIPTEWMVNKRASSVHVTVSRACKTAESGAHVQVK